MKKPFLPFLVIGMTLFLMPGFAAPPLSTKEKSESASYIKELKKTPVQHSRNRIGATSSLDKAFEGFFAAPPKIDIARLYYNKEQYAQLLEDEDFEEEMLYFPFTQSYERLKEETESKTSPEKSECKNLTLNERISLFVYTTQFFGLINPVLRNGTEEEKKLISPITAMISSALKKIPPYTKQTVRGQEYAPYLDEYTPGKIVTIKTFLSTSVPGSWFSKKLDEFPVIMEITSKTGKDISPFSGHIEESEVLFDMNARFKVVEHKKNRSKTVITMVEVE
ncbi:MAG: hypothetical protein HQM10_02340 [Candidatus Riflebacteria bacterium]|nr:hypothetical protein [Candidatus Riflebacteria bacterium]